MMNVQDCAITSQMFFNADFPLKSFCESTPNTGDPQDECEEGKLAGQTEDLGATCYLLLATWTLSFKSTLVQHNAMFAQG